MSYDPRCEELARYFLDDDADLSLVHGLAQAIQDAIEGWVEELPLTLLRRLTVRKIQQLHERKPE